MGFSLKRALAGAVMGAANAQVEIADANLKEAAEQRKLEEQFARQKELIAIQDENAMRREQSMISLKEEILNKRSEKDKLFLNEGLDALKKDGVNPGSIEGQRRLAEMAARNGNQNYADKFFDNAIRMGEIESKAELRKAEIATRLETARMAREARSSGSDDKEEARLLTLADLAGKRVRVTDREGKTGSLAEASNQLQALALEAKDRGMATADIKRLLLDTSSLINLGIRENPNDPNKALFGAIEQQRRFNKWAPEPSQDKKSSAPPPPPAPPVPVKKDVVPGVFSGFGGTGNRPPLDVGKLPLGDNINQFGD